MKNLNWLWITFFISLNFCSVAQNHDDITETFTERFRRYDLVDSNNFVIGTELRLLNETYETFEYDEENRVSFSAKKT